MNVVTLTGNLCKDIEIKNTKNNKLYTENTIGVRKDRKDADGNYGSDFIDFVCFEGSAKYLGEYAKKGDKVEILGQLRTDSWKDDNGNYKSRVYVVVEKINILTARQKESKEELPF